MKTVLCVVAIVGIVLGAVAARAGARVRAADDPEAALPGATLAAARVAAVALVSLPVLWLALGSEAAEWPGIVCAAGVLRLGTDAGGAASLLPWALGAALAAKLVAVGATGAWIVCRRTSASSARPASVRRAATWMLAAGACVAVDGTASVAWATLPRDAPRVYSGCCTASAADAGTGRAPTSDTARTGWTAAFLGAGAGAALLTGAASRAPALRGPESPWWPAHGAAAAGTAVAGGWFATCALAPARLALPLHECAFCLLDRAPENWLGVAALAAAPACTGWAWLAARTPDGGAKADSTASQLLGAASAAAGSAVALGAAGRWLT